MVILGLAFGIQAAYLLELQQRDSFLQTPFCGVDAVAHLERAAGLLDGSIPGERVFYFTPLYPFFLAILKITVGDSLFVPVYLQAMLQILGLAALYGLGRYVYGPWTGAIAALGLGLYGHYVFYTPCFDQALLTTPFLTLAVFLLLRYHGQRCGWLLVVAGLAAAVAVISRPNILLVLPGVLLWLLWQRVSWREFGLSAVLLLIPLSMAIAPLTWHNYRVSGQWVLMSNNFGVNLFTGNNPYAHGLDSLAHAASQPAVLHFTQTVPRIEAGETSFAAEVINYLRTQPADALELLQRKVWLWFGETELVLTEPFFPLQVSDSVVLGGLPLTWQPLAVIALLGLLLVRPRAWERASLLWLVYGLFSLSTIVFFIQLRFRLPFVPFAFLMAAALLTAVPRWSRESPRRFWRGLAAMVGVAPFIPGLNLFVLLYGFGGWRRLRWWRLMLLVVFVLGVGWWQRAEVLASDVGQPIDIYLGPPLATVGIMGQTFQMDCDGFNAVAVTFGTFHETPHNVSVTVGLATDASMQTILYTEMLDGSRLRDYEVRRLTFDPIADSAGESYFLFVTAPDSTLENTLTLRGYSDTPIDYYPNGMGLAGPPGGLQPVEGDMAFTAFCNLTLWQKLKEIWQ